MILTTILLFFLVFLTYKLVLAHNELQTQVEEIKNHIIPNTSPVAKRQNSNINTTEEMKTTRKPIQRAGNSDLPKAQDENDPESGLDRFQDNLEKILPKISTFLPSRSHLSNDTSSQPPLIEAFERDKYDHEHVAKTITPKIEDAFVTTIKPQHYQRSSSRGWKKLLNPKIKTEIAHRPMSR